MMSHGWTTGDQGPEVPPFERCALMIHLVLPPSPIKLLSLHAYMCSVAARKPLTPAALSRGRMPLVQSGISPATRAPLRESNVGWVMMAGSPLVFGVLFDLIFFAYTGDGSSSSNVSPAYDPSPAHSWAHADSLI